MYYRIFTDKRQKNTNKKFLYVTHALQDLTLAKRASQY